jgi:dTDP-4-amino-4,6-dideoxygalactose transaminase
MVRHDHADELLPGLKAAGIGARSYYRTPTHLQPAMAPYAPTVELPGTTEAARTILALPISPVLNRANADEVVAAVGAFVPV